MKTSIANFLNVQNDYHVFSSRCNNADVEEIESDEKVPGPPAPPNKPPKRIGLKHHEPI